MKVTLHRTWRLLVSSWLRMTKWEYWPSWLSYLPVGFWIAVLAIRYRNLVTFTAANPAILAGGFVGESKIAILNGLSESRERVARSELAIPANRQCPGFDVRTRQGRLSLSSASAYVDSSSHQNASSKRSCNRSALPP